MPSGVGATRRDPGGCPSAPCVAGTRVRFGCPRRGQTVERCRFARRLRRGSIASRPGWAHPGSGSLARDACRRDLHRRPQSAASSHPRRGDRPVSAARRDAQEILEDLAEAIDAAAERVALGKNRWDGERPLRLAGEAVVGRLGDIAKSCRASSSPARASCPGPRSRACGSSLTTHITASTTSGSGAHLGTMSPSWTGSSVGGSARTSTTRLTRRARRGERALHPPVSRVQVDHEARPDPAKRQGEVLGHLVGIARVRQHLVDDDARRGAARDDGDERRHPIVAARGELAAADELGQGLAVPVGDHRHQRGVVAKSPYSNRPGPRAPDSVAGRTRRPISFVCPTVTLTPHTSNQQPSA